MQEELQSITEDGIPASRLTDADAARTLALSMWDAEDKRRERNAKVKGLVDGNPPYSASAIAKAGQRGRSNFNSGQSLAYLNTSKTAYYDLFSEVGNFATVTCRTGDPENDSDRSQIITEAFQALQETDESMDYGIQLSQHDMILYGAGPHLWEANEWKSRARKYGDVVVSNNEKSDVSLWTKMLVVEKFTPAELYNKIADPEEATKVGWNVSAVQRLLLKTQDQHTQGTQKDWEEYQQRIRNNNLNYTGPDKIVRVARMFWREFRRKGAAKGMISEGWVSMDHQDVGWLYKKVDLHEEWKQVVAPFMLDRGDGTYHSIKGLGARMFSVLLTRERLSNQQVDAGFMQASLHVRATSTGKPEPVSIMNLGHLTQWPGNVEPMNFNANNALNASLAVGQALDAELQSNLASFRPQVAAPSGNPRTAFEVAANVNQQSVLTKSNINRYFEQLDDWYAERFRRAIKFKNSPIPDAGLAEFHETLERNGITLEMLRKCKVKATRTIGQGSQFMRRQTLTDLLGIAASLPEGGKQKVMDDYIASTAGKDQVARYNPKSEPPTSVQQQIWEANQENTTLRVGGEVIHTGAQNDIVHAEIHMVAVAEAVGGLQQGGDPAEVAAFGFAAMKHVNEDHFPPLASDPLRKPQFEALVEKAEMLTEQLQGLANVVEVQRNNALAQEQADTALAGMTPEQQLKAAETQAKLRERNAKTTQQLQLNEQRHQQNMRHQEERMQMEIANATTRLDLNNV